MKNRSGTREHASAKSISFASIWSRLREGATVSAVIDILAPNQ